MGRINGRKAAVALTAGLVGFAGTGMAVAKGGISANLALSGSFFTVTIGGLSGQDFSLFMDNDTKGDDHLPVARVKIKEAKASDLCLSTTVPNLPAVGEATLSLRANGQNSVDADDLIVGSTDIKGSLRMADPNLGIDASQVNPEAPDDAWGLQSKDVQVVAEKIIATSVGAKQLNVSGVEANVRRGTENAC